MKSEYQEEQAESGFPTHHCSTKKISAEKTATAAACSMYKECMKNHAAVVGGLAVDGCGEFMAGGSEGTMESLKCAACNCHRNFHRKEMITGGGTFIPISHRQQFVNVPSTIVRNPKLAESEGTSGGTGEHEGVSNPSGSGSKKRFRTKFTQEQKEKMVAFGKKLGWKIQKHDEAEIEQFCKDTNVNRQVLKVWLHNNKDTLAKK